MTRSVPRAARPRLLALFLAAGLALAACDSPEERAEAHFRSGLALVEAGDVDRALVEFRNVFALNGRHAEARRVYAALMLERGDVAEAGAHLRRLVEEHPNDLDGRVALAELLLGQGDWDEASREIRQAEALSPDAPAVLALTAARDYRGAASGGDAAAEAAAVARADAAVAALPVDALGGLSARRVLIDTAVRQGDFAGALAMLDPVLSLRPDLFDLQDLRLRLLYQTGDRAGAAARLEAMVVRWPERAALRDGLIALFLTENDPVAAQAALRRLAAVPATERWARRALVDLLAATEGPAAARAEFDRLVAEAGDAVFWRRLRAEAAFRAGQPAEAIADLRALASATPPGDGLRDARVSLARMLVATGTAAEARAQIDTVLAEDPGHVEALKMRAGWDIEDGRADAAIVALRRALTAAPTDPEIMLLMAEAHLRDGARDLAAERFALAVEVSGRNVRESLRYAAFLAEGGRADVAERVLRDALQRRPGAVDLLEALVALRIGAGQAERAGADLAALRDAIALAAPAQQPALAARADALALRLLLAAGRTDEAMAQLRATLAADPGQSGAAAALVELHLARGDADAALADLAPALALRPDDARLRFLRAGVHAVVGETAQAEAVYRALLHETPGAPDPARALAGLLDARGAHGPADAVLADAIAAADPLPALALRRVLAARLAARGEIEPAIAAYEALVAAGDSDPGVLNNLAGLLSTWRDDPDSLARAEMLARPLRALPVPAFRDTLGWIAWRRGNTAGALALLEEAAAALPTDATVLAHLGLVQAAAGQADAARATLDRALALGAGRDHPSLTAAAEARAALAGPVQ